MRFQKILSNTFKKVFFVLFLIFGLVMVFWFSSSTLKNTRNYNLNIFATILAKLDGVEGESDPSRDALEFEKLGNDFIQTIYSPDIDLFIVDDSLVYVCGTDDDRDLSCANKCCTSSYGIVDYRILGRYLYIASLFYYHSDAYYLIYSVDISQVYLSILEFTVFLLLFLLVSGMIASYVIQSFSRRVTKPLDELTEAVSRWDESGSLEFQEDISEITELHILLSSFQKMDEEIQEKIQELQEQNAEKQRFIDSLTHEIRTPLTSIIGYSSLMEQAAFDEEKARKSFHMIHDNGLRLRNLTENLVRLILLNEEEIRAESFSMHELASELRDSFEVRMKAEEVELEITGDDFTITTDRELFVMMLSNFVDNAFKAVKDMPTKKITLKIDKSSISIIDSGRGIPAEDMDKIFEPFFMVDRSRKRDSGGFGLGLAICDRILRKLRMRIDVQSDVGCGTHVTIHFPEDIVS